MIGFTKALAQENAKKGITVNAIAPGYIDTEMVSAVPKNVLEQIIAGIPVGRLGMADEIARCVAFLAAEDAGYITGSTLTRKRRPIHYRLVRRPKTALLAGHPRRDGGAVDGIPCDSDVRRRPFGRGVFAVSAAAAPVRRCTKPSPAATWPTSPTGPLTARYQTDEGGGVRPRPLDAQDRC